MKNDRCMFMATVKSVKADKNGVTAVLDVDASDVSAFQFLGAMRNRDVSVTMEPAQQALDLDD